MMNAAAEAVTETADNHVHVSGSAGTHGCSSADSVKEMSEDAADSSDKDEESKCVDDDENTDDDDDDDDDDSCEKEADAEDAVEQ